MKVLALMFNALHCSHFETALELLYDHISNSDDAYIVKCRHDLPICEHLYDMNREQCYRCQTRFESGIKKIELPKKNILSIKTEKKLFKYIPKEFKDVDELMAFKYDGIEFGLAVASTIISIVKDHRFDTLKYKEIIRNCLKTSFITYNTIKELLKKDKFDRVYLFSGRGAEYKVVFEYCRKRGIDAYIFDKMGSPDKYILSKNYHTLDLGRINNNIENFWKNSTNPDKEKIGEDFFINSRKGLEQGWLSYIKDQVQNQLPDNFNSSKKNIAVYNSSVYEYATNMSWKNHIYKDEIDGLWQILNCFKDNDDFHFYLRIHPNQKNMNNEQSRELKKIGDANFKNLTIITADDIIDTYALLEACDTTLVFVSTVGIEACYWGKPVILAGRTSYQKLDCSYNPQTHKEVVELLKSDLKPKNKRNTFKYGYYFLENGINYKYFKSTSLFSGKFMDEELNAEISKLDRYKLRFHKNIDKVKKILGV